MSSDQLKAWMGEFGDEYTDRNIPDEATMLYRSQFWWSVLANVSMDPPKKILEIGANVGANLSAIDSICKGANIPVELKFNEPNEKARKVLYQQWNGPPPSCIDGSLSGLMCEDNIVDMSFTCGVLIHVQPSDLKTAMREIYRTTSKYIVCAEYFSPDLREIQYRNRDGMLWAGDYGSYWLDNFQGLRLINYRFAWKRVTGMDNLTVWVFQKAN